MSTHSFRASRIRDEVRVFQDSLVEFTERQVEFPSDDGYAHLMGYITIHGTRDERLKVLKAWAAAEGLRVSLPITDDYGHQQLVPA